ncbi:hypothetical protein GCM10007887_38470 [Methylobacterium haplocladii]|uniref:Uncharacterized protein n=1 Tax=Methylobacterium haplocladii TaxID=1176176 RepID=A0A512ITH7_9HYPH|nr:hypothetical protein MHA02_34020 [Methylobacterium haplocladii]GLS61151.1 hypothetical protein GCM10007887_38470 [Methylobacterium haplocladii]
MAGSIANLPNDDVAGVIDVFPDPTAAIIHGRETDRETADAVTPSSAPGTMPPMAVMVMTEATEAASEARLGGGLRGGDSSETEKSHGSESAKRAGHGKILRCEGRRSTALHSVGRSGNRYGSNTKQSFLSAD